MTRTENIGSLSRQPRDTVNTRLGSAAKVNGLLMEIEGILGPQSLAANAPRFLSNLVKAGQG